MDCLQFTTFSWQPSPIKHLITLIDLHPQLEVHNAVSLSRQHESTAHLEAEVKPESISNAASIVVISNARLLEIRLQTETCPRKVPPYHSSVKAELTHILEDGEVRPVFCSRVLIGTPWRRMIIKFMSLGEADLCQVFYIAADNNRNSLPAALPVMSQLQLLMQPASSSIGGTGEEPRAAALHPVQRMALAMAEALAAGSASEGTPDGCHKPGTNSPQDNSAVVSSLTQMVQQVQLELQTSMASIITALGRMDARMTRAETSLVEMEGRLTKKLEQFHQNT